MKTSNLTTPEVKTTQRVLLRRTGFSGALRRLSLLAPLNPRAEAAVAEAATTSRMTKPRREILREGSPVPGMLLILSGWVARVRYLPDGRRQVIGLLLPGDLVGNCRQCRPVSVSTVVSLTAVEFCAAPLAALHPSLGEAYAVSHALDEAYLIAQVMRLGRLNAEERLADLLLELLERLNTCDTAGSDNFRLPLSQEVLSDTLGLSSVHFNRTLQRLRHRGDITFKTGLMTIANPALLGDRIGHVRARVTADSSTPSESAEDPCL